MNPEQEHNDADRQNTRQYMAELERMEMIDHAICPTCQTEVHKDELHECEQCVNRGCVYCLIDNENGWFCDTAETGKIEDSECYQNWRKAE